MTTNAKKLSLKSASSSFFQTIRQAVQSLRHKCTVTPLNLTLKRQFKKSYKTVLRAKRTSCEDFDFIKRLGSGSCAIVFLSKNKRTKELIAMKVIDTKLDINSQEYMDSEMRIAASVVHPFVLSMKSFFMEEEFLCCEFPYMPGGSLISYVIRHGPCSTELTRFFGAQLALAVDYLHGVGVAHRDLKLDNVLIDADGYLKLVDLGFAKKSSRGSGKRMRSPCGTLAYMAPEIIAINVRGHGCYDRSVDWWSYGVMIYNLLLSKQPFGLSGNVKLDIMCGFTRYPDDMDARAVDFLKGLLTVEDKRRLGCGSRGSKAVFTHPFFDGIDWVALFHKKIPAPYIPDVDPIIYLDDDDVITHEYRQLDMMSDFVDDGYTSTEDFSDRADSRHPCDVQIYGDEYSYERVCDGDENVSLVSRTEGDGCSDEDFSCDHGQYGRSNAGRHRMDLLCKLSMTDSKPVLKAYRA